MSSPTKRSLERLDEIAFKAGDDGLELYAESWRKAKKKGDVGLPVREALKIEIRKALDQAREEQRERDAEIAEGAREPDFVNQQVKNWVQITKIDIAKAIRQDKPIEGGKV